MIDFLPFRRNENSWILTLPLLFLFVGESRGAALQTKPRVAVVIADNAPLQKGSDVVARAVLGEVVGVTRIHGEWRFVEATQDRQTVKGWIRKEHLQIDADPPQAIKKSEKDQRLAEAKALLDKADKLWDEGKKREVIPMHRQALALRARVLGLHHQQVIESLSGMGEVLRVNQRFAESERCYLHAVRASTNVYGPAHEKTADVLWNLGFLYYWTNRVSKAVPFYERALPIYRKQFGDENPKTAELLSELANMHRLTRDFAKARRCAEQAHAIQRKTLGENSRDTLRSLLQLGMVHEDLFELTEARRCFEQCVKRSRDAFGEEHEMTATALHALGRLTQRMGELQTAKKNFEASWKITQKTKGARSMEAAFDLNGLASVLGDLGDHTAQLPLLEKSLDIVGEIKGKHSRETIIALSNLGVCYGHLGNWRQARRCFEQALSILDQSPAENRLSRMTTLANFSVVLAESGELTKARRTCETALDICRSTLGRRHPQSAHILFELAEIHRTGGNQAAAKALLEECLAIRRATFSKDHPAVGRVLWGLTNVADSLHDLDASQQYGEQALAVFRGNLPEDAFEITDLLATLGHNAARRGDFRQAGRRISTALRLVRQRCLRTLPALSAKEQLDYLGSTASFYHYPSLVAADRDNSDLVRASAEWLANLKAMSHEVLSQRTLLARQSKNAADANIMAELNSVRGALARQSIKIAPPNQRAAHQRVVADLQTRENELVRRLSRRGFNFEQGDPWVRLEEIRARMPRGAVLFDFSRYGYREIHKKDMDWTSQPRYAVWVTPAAGKGEVQFVDLGSAQAIDEAVRRVRTALRDAPQAIRKGGESAAEQKLVLSLSALAKLVFHPVLAKAKLAARGNVKQLILSPDSQLWLTPWAALPQPNGRYTVEDYELRHIVSSRDLVTPHREHDSAAPIVLADPDFDGNLNLLQNGASEEQGQAFERSGRQTADRPTALPRFARLPATAAEAKAIIPSIEQFTGVAPEVFTRDRARESIVKAARSPRVLTFSTHGFFLPDQPVNASSQRLVSEHTRSAALTTDGKPLENPLLRCGLVLAGCNHHGEPPAEIDDGVLTGLEIVGTDLRGTELVVLSACETGVGEVHNGEGVAGLRQAFQLAGAEAVVASLWSVSDLETARLMKSFFEHLANGKTKSAALRAAQLERIASRRDRHEAAHPFYWAAFTVSGK